MGIIWEANVNENTFWSLPQTENSSRHVLSVKYLKII